MTPELRCELLDSLGLVGRGLGTLDAASLPACLGDEKAWLEMSLVLLKSRLRAGVAAAGLMVEIRRFLSDVEDFLDVASGGRK